MMDFTAVTEGERRGPEMEQNGEKRGERGERGGDERK